jgi:putative permease
MLNVFKSWMERYFANEETVLLAVMFLVTLLVFAVLGHVLAPMITAIIIAFLMQGTVLKMKSWGLPHIASVTVAFLILVSLILLALLYVLPTVWDQSQNLLRETPRMLKEGQALLLLLPEKYPTLFSEQQVTDLMQGLQSHMGQLGQYIFSFSLAQLPVLAAIAVYLVLVPILVFFFLKDADPILSWLSNLLPKERPVMTQIWREMNQQIANYVRGKFIEIVIVSGVSVITFTLLGLNYALLLGVMVGFSVLIPYIGALVVALPIALIAFFQWGLSSDLMYIMVAYTIIQALDGNVLVPVLFSEAVNLHPVAIILSVFVFGGLWGFWGVFFAIPLATLFNAILNAWPTPEKNAALQTDS